MKHLKMYEDYYSQLSTKQRIASYACLYLENIVPVSVDDGFLECRFEFLDDNKLEIAFFFKSSTSDESYEKFYEFLEKEKLKIKKEHISNRECETNVTISMNKIKKYSDIYENTLRYNL